MPWSGEKKALVEQAVGSSQYTSSDESDFSDDENGQPKLSGYRFKKLPWERSALTKVKKALDDAHINSLNVRARVNMVARRFHSMPCTKPRPIDGLEWAVRPEDPATFTSPTFSPPTPTISSHNTPVLSYPPTPRTPSHSNRLLGTGRSSDTSAKRKKVPKSKKDTVRRPLKRAATSPEY